VTFLGVSTSPVSPPLSSQLNLQPHTGLVIDEVSPGSPAASVLKENDILIKLDDQWLIDPFQFSVLVRNHHEGDEVSITFIRGGKQDAAKIKLGMHEAPKLGAMGYRAGGPSQGNLFYRQGPEGGMVFGRDEIDSTLSLLQGGPESQPPRQAVRINRLGDSGRTEIEVDTGDSHMVYKDTKGTLDLTILAGKKTLVATDAQGKQLFSGPVDTPDERNSLPADLRSRFEKLSGMKGFRFKTDGDFHGPDLEIAKPELQSLKVQPLSRAPNFL